VTEDQPHVPGPPADGDRDDHGGQGGRQHGGERQREQQRRERQEDIGHAHDHFIEPAAEVARREPERDADGARDQQDDERDQRGYPGAVEHPGQDVAADVVGAEPVLRRWRVEHGKRVRGRARVCGKRREQGSEQRHDDDAGGSDRPHDQQRVRPQPAAQGRAAGDLGDLGGKGCGRLDHRSLILGSMAACTMSTIRFATTYARATNNVTPRMAGVSSVEIDAAA